MADDNTDNGIGEIIEETPLLSTQTEDPDSKTLRSRSVRTNVPEADVHVYRQGKGPIAVFKAALGGWDQDQLEVRDILDKYGFKMAYAFNPDSGRGVPIRFNPRNGRSLLSYRDGAVIYIDGEPKVLDVDLYENLQKKVHNYEKKERIWKDKEREGIHKTGAMHIYFSF